MAKGKKKRLKISKKGWIGILIGALAVVGGYLLIDNYSADTKTTGDCAAGKKCVESPPPTKTTHNSSMTIQFFDSKTKTVITTPFTLTEIRKAKPCYGPGIKGKLGGCSKAVDYSIERKYDGENALEVDYNVYQLDQKITKDGKDLKTMTLHFFGWDINDKDKGVAEWQSSQWVVKDKDGKIIKKFSTNPPFRYTFSGIGKVPANMKGRIIYLDSSKVTNAPAATTSSTTTSTTASSAKTTTPPTTTVSPEKSAKKESITISAWPNAVYYKGKVSNKCRIVITMTRKDGFKKTYTQKCDKKGTYKDISFDDAANIKSISFYGSDNGGWGRTQWNASAILDYAKIAAVKSTSMTTVYKGKQNNPNGAGSPAIESTSDTNSKGELVPISKFVPFFIQCSTKENSSAILHQCTFAPNFGTKYEKF